VTRYSNDGAEFFCELSPIACHGMKGSPTAPCRPLELVVPCAWRRRSSAPAHQTSRHDESTAQPCAVTKNSSSRNALALSWPSPVRR